MQHWAKRGLQTALVTGGLLMLGTGIASADEDVNPDTAPSSPLDGSVTIPVDIGDNAVGTPGGQYDLPEHQGEYSSKQITEPVKQALTDGMSSAGAKGVAAPELPVSDATKGVDTSAVDSTTAKTGAREAAPSEDDPFRGNKGSLDLVVPIQIANNALALFGPVEVSGEDHQQSYDGSSDVTTDGSDQSLAGNVVDIDHALPIQIANNAGGIGGDASSTGNSASQETTTGGDVTTDGHGKTLSGNIIAPQGATPVQLNNNAAVLGGTADSSGNTSSSDTHSGGALRSDGTDGVLSGNIAGVPVAFPVEGNNTALSGLGIANSSGNANTADAQAGDIAPGTRNRGTYAESNGDGGVLSGNIAQPQAAGDGAVHGVAGTAVGMANSGASGGSRSGDGNTNETTTKSGGYSNTSGVESVAGGNIADAPVAAPVEAFCVAGSLVGKASSSCDSTTESQAGGSTFTDATDSVLGGNGVHAPVGTTLETFGVGATGVGTAESDATEEKEIFAGGYNGSRGDGSTGGGNIIQTPVAAPVEAFAIGGGAAGDGSGTASETKDVNVGGPGNTEDDDAVLGSNVIASPIAQPVQVFGIGGSAAGDGKGHGTADTTTTSGGFYIGSGKGGTGSGNILQAASSAPAQVFGVGGSVGGEGSGTGDNTSTSEAGGDATTDGSEGEFSGNIVGVANSLPAQAHGLGGAIGGEAVGASSNVTDSTAGGSNDTDGTGSSLGGNIVAAPVGGAAGVFGSAAGVLGHATGAATNDVVSTSGGDSSTAGDDGSLAGNIIGAQALPVAQVFGDGVSVFGFADGVGDSTTDAMSGGDLSTSGDSGSLSGNILDVPAAAVAQIFGNALAVGGEATGTGDNTLVGTAGGTDTSAQVFQIPVGVLAQIFNFSGPIGGEALGVGTNSTDVLVGQEVPQLDLIFDGAEMPIDGMPSLDGLGAPASALRMDRSARSGHDVTPALMPRPVSAPAAPADLPELPGLPGLPGMPELPGLPALPEAPATTLPAPAPASDLPEVAMPLPAPALPEAPATTLPAPALPADAPIADADLPEVGTPLPAPALPDAPAATLPAPALPETGTTLPSAEVMPKTAHTMPATKEAGLRGLWAKFIGMVTNQPMHIEG